MRIKVPVNVRAFLLDLAFGTSARSSGRSQDPASFRMGRCGWTLADCRATRRYVQTTEYLKPVRLGECCRCLGGRRNTRV